MALHAPTHPASHVEHHVLRNTLVAVGAVALVVAVLTTATLIKPVSTPSSTTVSEPQYLIEFRAGERADLAIPITSESSLGGNFGAR